MFDFDPSKANEFKILDRPEYELLLNHNQRYREALQKILDKGKKLNLDPNEAITQIKNIASRALDK